FTKLGYLGYGAWTMRDVANNDEVNTYAWGFGNRSGWLNWGLTYKTIDYTLSGVNQESWSTDFGFLFRITPEFNVGLTLQDILTGRNSPIASGGRLGFGFEPIKSRLLMAGDLELGNSSPAYGHFGLELNMVKGMALRAGLDRSDPTAGLSIDLGLFNFDYAAVFENNQTVHRFETGIKFLPARERPFSIFKQKEFVLIDLAGSLKGGRTAYSFLGGVQPGVDSILIQIREAAKDPAVDGIYLRVGGMGDSLSGLAKMQELRAELVNFKKTGKKIVAYIEGAALSEEYYLAAIADKIVAPPGCMIGGFGKAMSVMRLKGLFEKLGIEWQIFTQGKFKDSFDQYSREKLTKEQETMAKSLLAELHRQLLTDIAHDRNISLDKIKELGDGMIFTSRKALELGLIDEIGYHKEARLAAAQMAGEKKEKEEAKIISPRLVEPEEVFLTQVFGVAIIEIDGEIVSGSGGENVLFGGRSVGSETVSEYIKQASDNVFVKAIILRINSPGGSAIASGEINKALQYAKDKEKVLIASIGSVGASGGYYIACAADKIVANKSSLTGSIGVIGYFPSFSELLKKIDISTEVIKEGEYSDMFSGLRKLNAKEKAAINALLEEDYKEFRGVVGKARGLSEADLDEVAQGQIMTGSQALDYHLIDQIGGFSDAIELAKKEAKIVGEPRLIYYYEPSMFSPFGQGMVESMGLKDGLLKQFQPELLLPQYKSSY
ncbi:MAG: signal peptide peptidase SppA, partial [bacterium]